MRQRDWIYRVAVILGILLLLFRLSFLVRAEFGEHGVRSLDLAISGGLTAALVILYFRQTRILNSQQELLTQELNREARQIHTETLRERVREWHGNVDREYSIEDLGEDRLNTPTVTGSTIESAPEVIEVFPDDSDFEVIPAKLRGDRYLDDLLENHAPELKELKERIERLQKEFVSLRDNFAEEYSDGVKIENNAYTVEPASTFHEWLFEQIVLVERGQRDDLQDASETAKARIDSSSTNRNPQDGRIWIRTGSHHSGAIYQAFEDSEDIDNVSDKVKTDAIQAIQESFDAIDDNPPYSRARDAAEVLDQAEQAVLELEHTLVEYEGMPLYQGQCKYLDQASVDTSE